MSASSEAEEAAQFTLLTEWLAAALQDQGSSISLPDEIVALFKSGIIQDDSSIRAFNKLFGSSDHTHRLRLDHGAFINVVAILLHLPYSHYQERLLFAFIHTIDLLKDLKAIQAILKRTGQVPASAEEIEVKRRKINNKLIHKMMQVLVLDEQEASMRLMAGHILFALLHGSVDAQQIARKQSGTARLGPLVDDDDDYILRIFTANIIREMCATTSEPHEFWPQITKRKKDRHEDFPLAQIPNSAWLGAVADYLSSRDVGRGFHGDSQPLISRLLSVSTPSHTFEDRSGGNILAVVAEKFVFVIPGTPTMPLALLEFVLDSKCQCSVDEYTSPDFRSDVGEDVDVVIDTAKRGYQLFKGAKSALDSARLVLPQYDQGEVFAKYASRNLQLLPPLPGREDIDISSRAESRSFRRLDVGMIDMSMDSEAEEGMASASDASFIVGVDTHISQRSPSRSRSRQSSRMTEAKLKEAHQNKRSESASFVPQGSLTRDEQGEPATQPRPIDPRMLTKRKSGNAQADVQADVTAGLDTNVNFATYVEQSKSRADNETGRSNAKAPQPSAEHRRSTIPPQRVESSPSNRAHRLTSRRPVAECLGAINSRPPPQTLEPERSLAQESSVENISEHRNPKVLRTGNSGVEPTEVASNSSAATTTKADTKSEKPQTTRERTQKSQPGATNPMDWDGGDMAAESTALPAAKKPRLTKSAANPATRKSRGRAQIQEETMHLDDSGASSMLKRPKPMNATGEKSQQTGPKARHDEFDIEDDHETAAPAPKAAKVTAKRVTNAVREKVESQVSRPAKRVSANSATKGRKVLQPMDTNTSLASTRARRGQPKSKRHIDDSDSDLENPNEATQDIPQKIPKAVLSRKQTSVAETDLQKLAVSTSREQSDEAQSDHEVPPVPRIPVRHSTKTTKVATAHVTLVTASPARLNEADTQAFGEESDDALRLGEAGEDITQPQKAAADAGRDELPDETAEDSYPMATTKSQGPRVSFGSKLGQIIQESAPHGKKTNIMAARTTPLSNAKSFVGSMTETRSGSPTKKPRQSAPMGNLKGRVPRRAGTPMKKKEKAVGVKSTAPIAKTKRQTAAPSRENAKTTKKASNGDLGPRTVAQQTQLAEPREADDSKKPPNNQRAAMSTRSTLPSKAVAPSTRSVTQQKAEVNEAVSRQEDVRTLREYNQSPVTRRAVQPRDINTTIDLTRDSDEAVSVNGPERLEHMRADLGGIENEATTRSHVTPEQNNDDTSPNRQGEQALRQSNRTAQAKLHALEDGSPANTPQKAKLRTAAGLPRGQDLATSKDEVPISREPAAKKARLVHFGIHGPHNQGILSPDKQSRRSSAASGAPPETEKHLAYNRRHSTAATPNSFVEAPRLQTNIPDFAGEVHYDDRGILVEDDTVMEDVGESAQEGCESSFSEDSAPAVTRHLLHETFKMGRSGSQSSRVDQNGSPRLQPQHPDHSTHLEDPDVDVTTEVANDHDNIEEEDLTASTEESALDSGEPASQDSDLSFHLTNEAPLPRQSGISICTRTQATITAASSPMTIKQVERKTAAATMKFKQAPRESLGLSKVIQEQYPQAQKDVTTGTFKKPALKTAVSKPFEVSPKMPIVNRRAPVQASDARRQPLKEVSTNYKKPTVTKESSTSHITELSSAAPVQLTKTQPKSSVQSHPTSEPLGPTPTSMKTKLLAEQADRNVQKEDTILENLNRGKSARQVAEDADRTLVEGHSEHQYRRRRPSDELSVSPVSPPPAVEHDISSRQDEMLWRKGSREAQTSVRDALLEITNTVLFRLESEERAIERKVNDYDVGCNNILKKFEETSKESFQHAGSQLVNKATARTNKLEAAFDRLQASKRNVRSADTKDRMQRAIKLREHLLAEKIEQMLEKERERVAEAEEVA